MDRIFDVASLIVIAAIIAVIVGSKNTRGQINALTKGSRTCSVPRLSAAR
jgi:hypothetical protein